jgi:hypothetical protein
MQRLEVSGAVRHIYIYIYMTLGGKGLERRGYSHLKEEALDRTVWRTGFGRDFGPVVRQTAERILRSSLSVQQAVRHYITFTSFSLRILF